MVTTRRTNTLCNRCPPKLSGPNHQGVIQHPALLQVFEQCRHGLVHACRLADMVFDDAFMGIPVDTRRPKRAAVVQLDKAHAFFGKPPCKQTVTPKASGFRLVQPVHRLDMRWLRLNINRLRDTHLHPGRELIRLDARCNARFIRMLTMKAIVQIAQQCEPSLAFLRIHRVRREEIIDGRTFRLKSRPLMRRWEKATRPVNRAACWQSPGIRQNNKCREVAVERAQPIRQPSAHAWKAIYREAAVHLECRRRMIRRLRFHAVQPSDFVSDIA